MTKIRFKNEIHSPEREIEDLIMLEDSTRSTLCAIHNTIHSKENFPCTQHKMIKLCPSPPKAQDVSRSKTRKKCRCCSPTCAKMYRAASANGPLKPPHTYCKIEKCKPSSGNSEVKSYISVEKTISCPEKMCCQNTSSFRTCSRSSTKLDHFAQNLLETDEVVNVLKGEIQKVKHQLHHISQNQITGNKSTPLKTKIPCLIKIPSVPMELDGNNCINMRQQIRKLREENTKLKRDIESKKKLLEKSRNDMSKAKDILSDYEKKVALLHVQALKSSKAMKMSKDKFYNCIQEKEEKIKDLKESNGKLEKVIEEKESMLKNNTIHARALQATFDNLSKSFENSNVKVASLTENNQCFVQRIDLLKNQLSESTSKVEKHKEIIEKLEKKLSDLNGVCKKIVSKTKKQKQSYETLLKDNEKEQKVLTAKLSQLSQKLQEVELQKKSSNILENKCQELEEKVQEYESFLSKIKQLEHECKNEHEKLQNAEEAFKKEKDEMEKLIEELTNVIKENKSTLKHMTEINKEQESIIKSQSIALLSKEEQLKLIETESENFKTKSKNLEKEVEALKRISLSEPCSKEACLTISKELAEIKYELDTEKDTQLLKEQIIQDQSQTILNLQIQVKEKMSELNKAQQDTQQLEEEIARINAKLIKKHQELDMEIDEKENLIEKLRILDCQKNQLSEEINDFEEMLYRFQETCGDNEKQKELLKNLERQITEQKQEWDTQKQSMAKEKEKAVSAAKFATQKLLDTVEDFQRQVDAQKKVQVLLTKMLHEKDEQLQLVKAKISSINKLTKDEVSESHEFSMKELFFNNHNNIVSFDQNTTTSKYSSCSSFCKNCPAKQSKLFKSSNETIYCPNKNCSAKCEKIPQIIKALSDHIQEEPSRE